MKYGHALDDGVSKVQDDIHRAAKRNIYGVEPRRMRKRVAVLRVGEEVDLVYVSAGTAQPSWTSRNWFPEPSSTCGSGVTAAVIALALEIAGAPVVSLYDGSWAEYAQRPEAVIEKKS